MLRAFEVLVGCYYLVFGIDGFLKRIPLPAPSASGLKFLMALQETQYILFCVKFLEILVGLSWVSGYGGGLAWVLFTPIWFNILGYHFVVNRREIVMPLLLLLSHVLLGVKYADFLQTVIHLGVSN